MNVRVLFGERERIRVCIVAFANLRRFIMPVLIKLVTAQPLHLSSWLPDISLRRRTLFYEGLGAFLGVTPFGRVLVIDKNCPFPGSA